MNSKNALETTPISSKFRSNKNEDSKLPRETWKPRETGLKSVRRPSRDPRTIDDFTPLEITVEKSATRNVKSTRSDGEKESPSKERRNSAESGNLDPPLPSDGLVPYCVSVCTNAGPDLEPETSETEAEQ